MNIFENIDNSGIIGLTPELRSKLSKNFKLY